MFSQQWTKDVSELYELAKVAWSELDQRVIITAVRQQCSCLKAYVKAASLNTFCPGYAGLTLHAYHFWATICKTVRPIRGVARCKNVGWTTMASVEREPIAGSGGRASSGVQLQSPWSRGRGQSPLKLNGFVIGTPRREAKVATTESVWSLFPYIYRLLSDRIWAILVTCLNIVGVGCASMTTLLPLLVWSGQKARGCGNGMDNGLFLPHCSAMAWTGTEF